MKFFPLAMLPAILVMGVSTQSFAAASKTVSAAKPTASATPQSTEPSSIDPAKKAEILKVLKLLGAKKRIYETFSHLMAKMQNEPGLSKEFLQRYSKKVKAKMPDLIKSAVTVYDHNYSMADLKAMDVFYSSPAGQKILSTQSKVMQESMIAGTLIGRETVKEVLQDMKSERVAKHSVAKVAAKKAPTSTPKSTSKPSIDPVKKAEILKLMKLYKMEKEMKQQYAILVEVHEHDKPKVREFYQKLAKEATKEVPRYINNLVFVINRCYSMEDLKVAYTFYSSPAGQKILAAEKKMSPLQSKMRLLWEDQIAKHVLDKK